MSSIRSPESATASCTAVSACAANGISALRETFEYPTPLTAILHRLSHMPCLPLKREPELRQRDIVVQFLEHDLDAAADFRLGVLGAQKVAGEQGTRRRVKFDDDAGVRHGRGEALVAG